MLTIVIANSHEQNVNKLINIHGNGNHYYNEYNENKCKHFSNNMSDKNTNNNNTRHNCSHIYESHFYF